MTNEPAERLDSFLRGEANHPSAFTVLLQEALAAERRATVRDVLSGHGPIDLMTPVEAALLRLYPDGGPDKIAAGQIVAVVWRTFADALARDAEAQR